MENRNRALQNKKIDAAFEIARAFIYGDSWTPDNAAWCGGCESRVPMVTAAVAAALEKTNLAQIFERVERSELHYRTSSFGAMSICLCSLIDGNGPSPSTFEPRREAATVKKVVRITSAVPELREMGEANELR